MDFLGIFFSSHIFRIFFALLKLLRLLLKVTGVTTEHQKWPRVRQNRIKKTFFLPEGQGKPWTEA